jgi:tetratricopeptide (TPR) repeat protein
MVGTQEVLKYDTQSIDLSTVVDKGLRRCRAGDWETGLKLLRKAARKESKEIKFPSVYYSYLGYGAARFENEKKDGLALCLHAVRSGKTEPDNYLNLARVYLLLENRQRAVLAVRHGLKLDPHHIPLLALRTAMGYRRNPVVPFLSRDRWVNRYLGRRRHVRLRAKDAVI